MNARFFSGLVLGAACLALIPRADAKLVFANTTIIVPAQWSDTEAVAVYKFQNTGPETVKITEVQPGCGCTTPSLSKDVFAPGESGEVSLQFAFGGRSGPAREEATVMTDLPSQPTIELMLQTTIPRVLDVTPLVLYWKQGEALAPKTAEIDLAPDLPFQKLEVGDAGPSFQVALKEVQHAAHYELVVTPVLGGNVTTPSTVADPHQNQTEYRDAAGNVKYFEGVGPSARAQIRALGGTLIPPAPDTAGPVTREQITLTLHLDGDKTRTSNIFAFIFSSLPAPVKAN